jgi:hypothetical protein
MLIGLLCLLSGCGADGAPVPPAAPGTQPGLSVGGQIKVGIGGSL